MPVIGTVPTVSVACTRHALLNEVAPCCLRERPREVGVSSTDPGAGQLSRSPDFAHH